MSETVMWNASASHERLRVALFHVGIKDPDPVPIRLVGVDELDVPRMGLIGVVRDAAVEDDVQGDVGRSGWMRIAASRYLPRTPTRFLPARSPSARAATLHHRFPSIAP